MEQDHLHSQPNSHGSPRRRRTRDDLSAPSDDVLARDLTLGRAEVAQDQQNGTRNALSQGMALTQELSMDRYPGSTLEGYNPDDDHQFLMGDGSFDMNFAEMSSYMSFDPTNSNEFQSPLLLADLLPSDVALVPPAKANGSFAHGQEALSVDFEGWPCFLCNPSSGKKVHPKTGRMFLEGLENTLRNHDIAQPSTFLLAGDGAHPAFNSEISVEPFSGRARDKLMVITQSILHKARKIHGSSARERLETHQPHLSDTTASSEIFSILPSTDDLEHLLQAYANRFEPYYASVPSRLLSPMDILDSTEERCSSILLLLMFAQGAAATPTNEARYLTSGLTEVCRLSWFSMVEKDVSFSRNPTMLRSALMFMNLAAWSGEKWHMDVSIISRSVSFSMLRKAACCRPTGHVHIG